MITTAAPGLTCKDCYATSYSRNCVVLSGRQPGWRVTRDAVRGYCTRQAATSSQHPDHVGLLCTGGVTSFKATDKKVVNKNPQQQQQQQDQAQDDGDKLPWHKMKNLGDMEGTLDGWVLFISFSLSLITAIVGVFQMIDKPYTAQVLEIIGTDVLPWLALTLSARGPPQCAATLETGLRWR